VIDTEVYRKKYVIRKTARCWQHPAGSEDVYELCRAVDKLLSIVRYLQCRVSTETQNEVERKLLEV